MNSIGRRAVFYQVQVPRYLQSVDFGNDNGHDPRGPLWKSAPSKNESGSPSIAYPAASTLLVAIPPMSQCGSWPQVYVLGVQKGATTSLLTAFQYHSDGVGVSGAGGCCESGYCVKPPDVGESHYLLGCTRDDGQHACSKYSLIFPKDKINVDSTPEYLNCPTVPGDLHTVMPASMRGNVRFIMIFREQSSRLLSIYNHRRVTVATTTVPEGDRFAFTSQFCQGKALVSHGHFEPSFHDFTMCLLKKWRDNVGYVRDWYSQELCWMHRADLARGMYYQALSKWRAVWPREQIFVIPFHQLVSGEQEDIMAALAAFTGVPSLPRTLPVTNTVASSWKVDAMCCATRCELLQLHEAENLKLYRQLADDQSTRLTPSQELPFSPFPQPDCVECPHVSTDCVPNADAAAAAALASSGTPGGNFETFFVDHPKTAMLCLVMLALLVFPRARRTLRKVRGGYTSPKRIFDEIQCSETVLNGDPTSNVAAGGDPPTSSVAAVEAGGEGGGLSHGKNAAWVTVGGAAESCRITLGASESGPPPRAQQMPGGGEKKSKKQKKPQKNKALQGTSSDPALMLEGGGVESRRESGLGGSGGLAASKRSGLGASLSFSLD